LNSYLEQFYPSRLGPTLPDGAAPHADAEDEDDWQITKGFKSGVDQVQAMLYGAMALGSEALGAEGSRDRALEGYHRNIAEAGQHAGNVTTYDDIDFDEGVLSGLNDVADYVLYGTGSIAPTILSAVAGGGIGGVAGKVALKKAVGKMLGGAVKKRSAALTAKHGLKVPVAQQRALSELAGKIGQSTGLLGTTVPMAAGSIFGEIVDETGEYAWDKALIGGLVSGGFEALPIGGVLNKLGVGQLAKEGIKKLFRTNDVLKSALTTALAESGTEAAQTVVEKATVKWVDDNYEVFSDRNRREIIDSALLGGIGGGLMGAVSGAAQGQLSTDPGDLPPAPAISPEAAGEAARTQAQAQGGDPLIQVEAQVNAEDQQQKISTPEQTAGLDEINQPDEAATPGEGTEQEWQDFAEQVGLNEINQPEENAQRVAQLESAQVLDPATGEYTDTATGEMLTNEQAAEKRVAALRAKIESAPEPEQAIESIDYKAPEKAIETVDYKAPVSEAPDTRKPAEETNTPADKVDTLANEAQPSPVNDLPEPSRAQIDAGNYRKGHVRVQGHDISIENPAGSVREGVDAGGKPWRQTLKNHYGYIKRTKGADGEQVDVLLGNNLNSDRVFVVNQIEQETGAFDEHKVLMGFNNRMQAVRAYRDNYQNGWKVGEVEQFTGTEFKRWLKEDGNTAPVDEQLEVEAEPAPVDSPSDFQALVERQGRKTRKKPRVRYAKGSGAAIPFDATTEGRVKDLKQARKTLREDFNDAKKLVDAVAERADKADAPVVKDAFMGTHYDAATLKRMINRAALRGEAMPDSVRVAAAYQQAKTVTRQFNQRDQALVTALDRQTERLHREQREIADRPAAQQRHYDAVAAAVKSLQTQLPGARLQVVKDVDALLDTVDATMGRQIKAEPGYQGLRGVYVGDTGTSYVVAGNVSDIREATQVALHESVAHHGLSVLLGDKLDATLDDVYRSVGDTEGFIALAGQYRADLDTVQGQRMVADEYIAQLAEDITLAPGLIRRIITAVREALRKLTGTTTWSDQAIKDLLMRSAQNLQQRPLQAVEISEDMRISETGETVKVTVNAQVALRRTDKRMAVLNRLKACVAA